MRVSVGKGAGLSLKCGFDISGDLSRSFRVVVVREAKFGRRAE